MPTTSTSFVLAILLAAATQAFGQSATITNYVSGPDQTNQFRASAGYGPNLFSLDGTPTNAPSAQQWKTTDEYNPSTELGGTSQMQYFNGWTPRTSLSGNKSVLFGGYSVDTVAGFAPGITNPSLYYNFNSSVAAIGDEVTYTVDFGIIGPSADLSGAFTNNDKFGFSLLASSGASLADFRFNPLTAPQPGLLQVEWINNGTNVVTNGTSFRGFQIEYGALYRFVATVQGSSLDMSIAGLQTQSGGGGVGITNYAVVTNVSIVTGGALSASFTAEDFERIAVNWELTSTNNLNPGANYMVMTAISVLSEVSVIPEPGTWVSAIALLSFAAYFARRRAAFSRI